MVMKSIRWKLTLSYLILATITLALTGTLLIITTRFFARQIETDFLRETAGDLLPRMQSVLRSERDPAQIDDFIRLAESLGNVNLRFIGPDGEVDTLTLFADRVAGEYERDSAMPRFRPPMARPDLSAMIDRMMHDDAMRFPDGMAHGMADGTLRLSFGGDLDAAYLEISDSGDLSNQLTRLTVVGFLISAIATLGASALIGIVVGSNLTKPIIQLTRAVETMNRGDMSARADATSRDEIGTLGQRFNEMADRLSDTIRTLRSERDSLRTFLADASHELRTPLTAMTTFVELLQREGATENQIELLADMQSQTRRMERTVADLLILSRLDGGVAKLATEAVSAPAIVREAWDNVARSVAHAPGPDGEIHLALTDETAPDVPLAGDRKKLVTLFENLFRNSLNALAGPGTIECSISDADPGRVFRVIDDGAGISQADLPHVFERFFRSKDTTTEGSGLGLSIVESIARAHGGTVAAISPVEGRDHGTEIQVTLPLGEYVVGRRHHDYAEGDEHPNAPQPGNRQD